MKRPLALHRLYQIVSSRTLDTAKNRPVTFR